MENKDIEKILQEQADNIKTKEFSEVWNEIENEVTPVTQKKTKRTKLVAILSSILSIVLVCIIVPSIVINLNKEEIKYSDITELIKEIATEEEFFNKLDNDQIKPIIKYREYTSGHCFYYDKNDEIVGGLCDLSVTSTYAAGINLQYFTKNVILNEDQHKNYTEIIVNNNNCKYMLIEHIDGMNLYHYEILTYYKDSKYLMDLYIDTDNIELFLNDFFI